MNASDALILLRESLVKHGLHDWHGELDNAKRRFGVCRCRTKTISISRPLCELNAESEVYDTILHEIAHALAWLRHGVNCGHDERWKAICREVGARPVASYDDNDVVVPEAPWVLAHKETGEVFQSYFKRPNRNWSTIWIRGRKQETYGQLEIRPAAESSTLELKTTEPKTADPTTTNPTTIAPKTTELENFDPQTVERMQYDALMCIRALAKERGIEVDINRCQYNRFECDINFRFSVPTPEGTNKEKVEFYALASVFGLNPEDYLKEFFVNNQRFRLCGIKPKNRKYPIIGKDDQDRRYKFELSVLEQLDR